MKKIILFIFTLLIVFNVNALKIKEKKINVSFNKCVDGDTASFKYKNEIIKVRFLAIDTPESVKKNSPVEPYGKEASEYTCNQLKKANNIYLEFDDNSDQTDKYNRYLAWVFVDGDLLQKKIIDNGFAEVAYLYGDYKYTNELKIAQKIAKKKKLGIWSNKKEKDNNFLLIILVIISMCLLFIFSKKYRKKVNNKIKKSIKKKIKM